MALSGKISSTIRGREYRIEWSAVQSVTNNTSTITCVHKLINQAEYSLYIDKRTNSCTVGGDTKSFTSSPISTSGGSTITLGTTTHTVTHDNDGTKSVTITGVFNIQATLSGSYVANITASDTITLNQIARVSVPTVSASSVQLGGSITIYTNRKSDVYVHDLTYSLTAKGSSTAVATGTIATDVTSSYPWSIPLALAAKIPSATEGTITVTCNTRLSGSTTVIGTKPISFAVTVPNNGTTKPKVTVTLSAVNNLSSAFDGIYVVGKSKVKVSYTASSDYSTIASYETKLLGVTSKSNPYTSAILSNSGTVAITVKVTDARGYYTEKTSNIEVIPYTRPRVAPYSGQSNIICTRCNSDGTIDPGGVYLLIKIGRKYEKMISAGTQKNYCKLSYSWKTDAGSEDSYSTPEVILERTASSDYVSVVRSGIVTSNTTAYNIRLIAEDDLGERDPVTITIPTAFATFHAPKGGHGFTLGGYHDPDKYDVFDCKFNAEFHGTVSGSVMGLLGSSGNIPGDGDLNDYRVPGVYAVASNTNAGTILNMPAGVKYAGLLRVYASTGQDSVTEGPWNYIMQEYRSFNAGTPEYRRRLETDGTGRWVYGEWVSGIDDIVHLAGSATQLNANVYTDNGVEVCQFVVRAGSDYHVLNFFPTKIEYGKNGKVLWTK